MSTGRYDSASPSVALEKGAYRIRAAPRRRCSSDAPRRTPKPSILKRREMHTAMLLLILAAATLMSFGTAYYLFVTRWAHSTLAITLPAEFDAALQVTPRYDRGKPAVYTSNIDIILNVNEDERFLAYLPHSGFHNQRIAFENALVLARILNRTLLVPPIRLGSKPLRYVAFDRLRQHLALSGKEGLQHCASVSKHVQVPDECTGYFDYTHIEWEWLVNLDEVKAKQRLVRAAWAAENLGLPDNEKDTLTLRDENAYDFRFLDAPQEQDQGRYLNSIQIATLASAPQRLVQLGTLFGSSRLRLKAPRNIEHRTEVRRAMAYTNPRLNEAADRIRDSLGGRGRYLGAHVRVGDAHFKANAAGNARVVWWRLVIEVLGLGEEVALELERHANANETSSSDSKDLPPPVISPDRAALRTPHTPLPPLPKIFTPHLPCRAALHTRRALLRFNAPLFIATDARHPLQDPALRLFLRTFPCTFFLSDFSELTTPLDGAGTDGWERQFGLPFLDALVAARAWAVVGTAGSTFSRFVEDVLWRVEWGGEIVQRG